MLSTISSELKSALETVTALQSVVFGRTIGFSGYPACRFFLVNVQQELRDNTPRYWRTYTFMVQVIQEMNSTAEERIHGAIDGVLSALSSDWTLDSSVQVTNINSAPVSEVEFPFGLALACDITLDARVLTS